MLYSSGLELEAVLSPRGHLAMSGDLFDGHNRGGEGRASLVSIGQRPEMVLSSLRRAGQPLQQRTAQPQMLVLLRQRNPASELVAVLIDG